MVDDVKDVAVAPLAPLSPLAPLAQLLSGYAGGDAPRHRLIWAYDARLADIVRTTREAMIGRIRLTWWHEVLTDENAVKGRGDPLVDALRVELTHTQRQGGLLRMIDGWEALLDEPLEEESLRAFAEGRGGGLFAALAGDRADADWLEQEGARWALWDLSGHCGDVTLATQAVAMAGNYPFNRPDWPRAWSALRIASGLARQDIAAGRVAPAAMTPRLYGRVLRVALIGR